MITTCMWGRDGHVSNVTIALRPDPDCPISVRLDITYGAAEPVTWVFARDLLVAGRVRPAGQGDVIVCPGDARTIWIHLRGDGPDGGKETVRLALPRRLVVAVLADCRRTTPASAERRHLEAAVDDLIARCRP